MELPRPSYLAKHPYLHKTSERVNVFGGWAHGFLAVSFVGATNVGSIQLHFDKTLLTNESDPQPPYHKDKSYEGKDEDINSYLTTSFNKPRSTDGQKKSGILLKKGEEVGMFHMGSTVVLVFECPAETKILKKEYDDMQMGEPITESIN